MGALTVKGNGEETAWASGKHRGKPGEWKTGKDCFFLKEIKQGKREKRRTNKEWGLPIKD